MCTTDDFCNDDAGKYASYEPVMELNDSYNNWIMRYDLHCASGAKIGMIGSSFFLGWALTLMILPRVSDIYGR